jgi:hypothetical protein
MGWWEGPRTEASSPAADLTGGFWTTRVKLVDLVLMVVIAFALVFLLWQLNELIRIAWRS